MTAASSASARASPPLAAALVFGLSVLAPGCARERAEAPAMGTERWLDAPDRLRVTLGAASRAASPAGGTSRVWDAVQIRTQWTRSEKGGQLTLTSPRLEYAGPDELDSILIRFAEPLAGLRFSLLWGAATALDRKAELRNRRELEALGDPPQRAFRVRGDEIAYMPLVRGEPGRDPLRHLFLRLPSQDAAAKLESVALVSKRDALAARPYGPVRHALRGETRSAYHVSSPARLEYQTRIAAPALLSLGVLSLAADAEVRVALLLGSGPGARVLLERRVREAGRAWQDFQVPLAGPGERPVTLQLALESNVPGDRLLVSNPTIVVPSQARTRPNVVLYVVDALRPDRLGFSGYAKDTSPFLDSLARGGVVFRNAYAQATWTKPSVATLLTSLHPQTHGVGARSSLDALPDGATTLQGLLREQGYLTAQFTANPFAGSLSNLDQGFDWAFGPEAFPLRDPDAKRNKPHSDDIHARLLPWLTAHAAGRFFVYVHSIDPHPPCSAPRGARRLPGGDSESDLYDEEIRFNDDQLRALTEALEALGLTRDTLLVVTADHGEAFGEHGSSGHGLSVRQEELRIPLLFSRPGTLPPRALETPVGSLDVMPTILGQCGVRFDAARLQGRDLFGAAAAGPVFASRFVYPDAPELPEFFEQEQFAVIDGRAKLVLRERGPNAAPTSELFDLARDPDERSDRSAHDFERTRALERALSDFRERQRLARAAFLRAHGDARTGAPPAQDLLERLKSLGYLK